MANLETSFAGLKLRNPFIVSSSGLTDSAAKNARLSEAGAGAIVLKSLFEEQITLDVELHSSADMHTEGDDYLSYYICGHKLAEYLDLIKESKRLCDVPVIASVNCYSDSEWEDFAVQIEAAGADALEINMLSLQTALDYKYGSYEQRHIDVLSHLRKKVKLPIIMKLGDNLTNPVALIDKLYAHGAAAVVLFNRFYQPDIDINNLAHSSGSVLSHADELPRALRWTGIASAAVRGLDFAVSGGVHDGAGIVKSILAGASAVEVCTALYQKSAAVIKESLDFVEKWMDAKGMKDIEQFKGMLNLKDLEGVNTFERTQFLKYYSSHKQ